MEKGFNDDELADIMSEIESLEQEFAEENAAKQVDSSDSTESVDHQTHGKASFAEQTKFSEAAKFDQEMDEVLDELSQMPVEQSIPHKEKVHHLKTPAKHTGAKTGLHFNVEGNMTVELGFQVGGQNISISVNENEGLVIALESGAKFILPVNEGHQRKAS